MYKIEVWRSDVNYEQHQRMSEWDQYYLPPTRGGEWGHRRERRDLSAEAVPGSSEPSPCDNNYTQLGDTRSDSRPFNPVRLTIVSKCLNHGVILLEWRIGKDLCGSFVVYGNIETVIVYYRDSVTRRGDGLTLDKYKNFVQHLSVRTKLLFGSYLINYSTITLVVN